MELKKLLVVFIYIFFISFSFSQDLLLSEESQISILTIYPGEEVYSMYGHCSIHIVDPILNIDWIYNYGTFDFGDKLFIFKFIYGKLDYYLDINHGQSELFFYKEIDKRKILTQTLNLDLIEKQKIFNFLQENVKPENRTYKYDFLFDNCSTRVFDVLDKSLNNSIRFTSKDNSKTFRQELSTYLASNSLLHFFIDVLLGLPADKKIISFEDSFMPLNVISIIDEGIIDHNKISKKLVKTSTILNEVDWKKANINYLLYSFYLILILNIIFIIKKPLNILPMRILYLLSGIVGLIICFMWFISFHFVCKYNLDILWALPFNIILFVMLKKEIRFNYLYILVYSVIIGLFVLSWPFTNKYFNSSLFPFLLIILLNNINYLINFNQKSSASLLNSSVNDS